MMTRRETLGLMVSVGATALLANLPAWAQGPAPAGDLATVGPLGDMALGPETAKVTIIEYASLTCSHCAAFHKETWPELKKRFVDTGKVRFILREFPLDPLALAAFMLARCEPAKTWAMVDLFFEQQRTWAFSEKPLDALQQMTRQAGFSQEKFESCLKDQKIYDAVNDVKNRGERLGINSTPTFFVNGKKYSGNMPIAEFEKIINPLLG
ncbi:DsbA family protein [Salinarimonas soli]|uniref:DsbA family protein n=1 Tax=Salinarimonas soli TaxID=1638099 RepID=A0A5B2VB74_9HYPH|nr:DsbA family protein [Salinarimonas soli]KAA2236214.1 DsbA family protein [Salinarimonas soli]